MIGDSYWSPGITVRCGYSRIDRYGWKATVEFCDDGFSDDDTDKGKASPAGKVSTATSSARETGQTRTAWLRQSTQ